MPLIEIKAPAPDHGSALWLAEVQQAGAAALACDLNNVWVAFEPQTFQGTNSPVVTIRALTGRSPAHKQAFAAAVATAVGRGLGVAAEAVWIHYQEMQPQDVWASGRWTA